ncbi:MAG: methyl coenzyme M reductase system, component A2 [Halobacteriota archaeon]|nr:methyl coenzyme M reductase system, component A2 [Halobacteriota archaeon]
MAEDFLIVDGLTKYFGDQPVIDKISFSVKEGQGFGILGKSGCGKTVLMHALRGIKEYEPTMGTVTYRVAACQNPECRWVDRPSKAGGKCAKCDAPMSLEEVNYWEELKKGTPLSRNLYERLSIMFQRTFTLYGDEHVIENVRRALKDAGQPEHKLDEMANELLADVLLTHRADHVAKHISGGEKQRVVFAMSMAKDPILFFADEPSGTLDPITAEAVHQVMHKKMDEGLTMLVTSHWPEAVSELSENAILLEEGKITASGNAKEVAKKFMEKFAGIEIDRKKLSDPLIKMDDLRKYFYRFDRGLVKAVDKITFNIMDGEIFGLVGVSGSGKTTTFKMIAGLVDASEGLLQIRMGDDWVSMNVVGPEGRGRVTPNISMLHQAYTLHPDLNVYENMESALDVELPADILAVKIFNMLKAVNFSEKEIDDILYVRPDHLSEGERHRVAIAKTLMKEPKIVLLDEPTGTADPLTRVEIAKSIKNMRSELGQTCIIVSHDIDFIDMVCDRAALMRMGKIMAVGDPDEVIKTMREVETPMGD